MEKDEEKAVEAEAPEMAEMPIEESKEQIKPGLKTLVDAELYLKTGCHIGTKFKTGEMRRYIFKVREDGLKVLNVETLDDRIRVAANFLAQFEGQRIAVVSRKLYGQTPATKFAEAIGGKAFLGRFVPGTFTNPVSEHFFEPVAVIVTEPEPDFQAIDEARKAKAPVLALCSTNNSTRAVDVVIPVNNKGRKSLALVYWLLARETLKGRDELKKDSEFEKSVEEFEYKIEEGMTEGAENAEKRAKSAKIRGRRPARTGRKEDRRRGKGGRKGSRERRR